MENKEELKKLFYDELILGESIADVTKDGIRRIDPYSEEGKIVKLGLYAKYMTLEDIIKEYPQLTEEEIEKLKTFQNGK